MVGKQVIWCAATGSSIQPRYLRELVFRSIDFANNCGLKLTSLTSDTGCNNISLWNDLSISARKDGIVMNFFIYKGPQIFITPDVCHLIKNLWAAVWKQCLLLSLEICETENLSFPTVSGHYINMLWQAELGANKEIRSCITYGKKKFRHPTSKKWMLVLPYVISPKGGTTTAWFIRLIDTWFELVVSYKKNGYNTSQFQWQNSIAAESKRCYADCADWEKCMEAT